MGSRFCGLGASHHCEMCTTTKTRGAAAPVAASGFAGSSACPRAVHRAVLILGFVCSERCLTVLSHFLGQLSGEV